MTELAIVEDLAASLAKRLGMEETSGADLMVTLRATVFSQNMTVPQIVVFLNVAKQYGLNPWTKEIYAFPDKNGAVIPVVGVDGWSRIINENPQFDGVDFEDVQGACACTIWRKDRSHPTRVTEYMDECYRRPKKGDGPWQSHPRRMLRHKALIQCARLAFGFAGIHDHDEAERIADAVPQRDMGPAEVVTPTVPDAYPQERFERHYTKWAASVASGAQTVDAALAFLRSKNCTPEQEQQLLAAIEAARKNQVTDVVDKSAATME